MATLQRSRHCLVCNVGFSGSGVGACSVSADGNHVRDYADGLEAPGVMLRPRPVRAIRFAEDRSNWAEVCRIFGRDVFLPPGRWVVQDVLDHSTFHVLTDAEVEANYGAIE